MRLPVQTLSLVPRKRLCRHAHTHMHYLPCPTVPPQTFLVGPKFKGVKMVPPGTHLVAYNSASGQGDFGPTTCFFAMLKSGQVGGWHEVSDLAVIGSSRASLATLKSGQAGLI